MADLNQMAIFVAVAKAQSFTGAAQQLGIPKSTVSARIGELEARLGAQLLHRTTRKVRLTESGQLYFERAARIVAEADEADRALSAVDASARGRLRVTASLTFGQAYLAPIVATYLERFPRVSVEVLLTDRRVDLIEEQIDVAIRAGKLSGDLVARRLAVGDGQLSASPGYLARHGTPTSPEALATHDAIVVGGSGDAPVRWTLARGDETQHVMVRPRLRASSFFFAKDAALAGAGIAFMPSLLAAAEVAAGRLVAVLPEWRMPSVALHAVYPPNRYLARKVRGFVDLLVESMPVCNETGYGAAEDEAARPLGAGT